ncbi:prestin-like isoform X1, partial [Vespula squamosa]
HLSGYQFVIRNQFVAKQREKKTVDEDVSSLKLDSWPSQCQFSVVVQTVLMSLDSVIKENNCSKKNMATLTSEMTVIRPIYRQDELHRTCKYAKPKRNLVEEMSKRWKKANPWKILKKSVPLISWLPEYNWKNNILGDIVAGITVAVMHIPQGMAYAILGNVPSIIGIYMAFFPVLIYFLFGTSRHNSMGTFAVVCMMTGKVVVTYSSSENILNNSTQIYGENRTTGMMNDHYTPIQVATVVTFVVGLTQVTLLLNVLLINGRIDI